MKRMILVLVMVIGVVLEVLVLSSMSSTRKAVASGGDIFHNQVDNLPVAVGGETRLLPKGTYVVTNQGPVLLCWYWIYQYWYLTAPLPIVVILGVLGLEFRRRKKPPEETAKPLVKNAA
jgi:hypothetical protein